MQHLYLLITFCGCLISMVIGFIMLPKIINFCKRKKLYDMPNIRKVHHNAIPRLGGISFIPSVLLSFILSLAIFFIATGKQQLTISMWTAMFGLSVSIIYVVGVVDDLLGLSAKVKFIAQTFSACLLPLGGLYINNLHGLFGITAIPVWIGIPLTIFFVVFIDNATNLIDGIDGLCASLSLISLLAFLYCFMCAGMWTYSYLIAGIIGVLIPFLFYNLNLFKDESKKIFMGDSGSLTLGFLLGFLLVKSAMDNPNIYRFPSEQIVLCFSTVTIPCFDVVRVIFLRLHHHKSLFQGDKNHIHHKLLKMGMSQRQALATIIILDFAFIVCNLLLFKFTNITLMVLADIAIYTLFNIYVNQHIKLHENTKEYRASR